MFFKKRKPSVASITEDLNAKVVQLRELSAAKSVEVSLIDAQINELAIQRIVAKTEGEHADRIANRVEELLS